MFIDTHCHLDFEAFDKAREELLKNCQSLGINQFINPATQRAAWQNLIELDKNFTNIHICFGLHPVFINNHKKQDLIELGSYTQNISTKLIGEIGLDKRFQF